MTNKKPKTKNSSEEDISEIELFDVSDPKYPHQHLDSEGGIHPHVIALLESLPKDKATILSYGWCGKVRTTEYILTEKVTAEKLYLKRGLKGSKKVRDLAKIEPFYSFLQSNKKILLKSIAKYCYSEKQTYRLFVEEFGGSPRTLERATITFLSIRKKKGLNGISGHEGDNLHYYDKRAKMTIKQTKKQLKKPLNS